MKPKISSILIIVAIIWFIFLCLLHYSSARPLWLDENLLFANINDSTLAQLFAPLKNTQVFPRIYLVGIKIISQPFDFNVLALRFLPFVFMLGGFFLWWRIYKCASKTQFFLFLLLFSFGACHFTTYYAAEFKQYSADLFVVALYVLFIYYQAKFLQGEISRKYLWFFSLVTPVFIFFSYASIFMLWIPLYNYFFILKRDKTALPLAGVYAALTVIFCVFFYLIDVKYSVGNSSMAQYWKDYFIDTSSLYAFFRSFTEGLRNITVRWFIEKKLFMGIATIFMPFCWVAIVKYCRQSLLRSRGAILDIDALAAILIAQVFVMGVLHMYPFTGCRATLFIAPFIFYMMVKGIYLVRKFKFVFYPLITVYVLFLCASASRLFSEYAKLYAK